MPIRSINPRAKQLRQSMTDAEHALWFQLRNRRLGGFKFKRQWTIGPYIVDFCCADHRLVVEVDGGQHSAEVDGARTARLERQGYRVVRFWNHDVLTDMDAVLTSILAELPAGVEPDPHPNPSPASGRGA